MARIHPGNCIASLSHCPIGSSSSMSRHQHAAIGQAPGKVALPVDRRTDLRGRQPAQGTRGVEDQHGRAGGEFAEQRAHGQQRADVHRGAHPIPHGLEHPFEPGALDVEARKDFPDPEEAATTAL
jgi:hypothetical protein